MLQQHHYYHHSVPPSPTSSTSSSDGLTGSVGVVTPQPDIQYHHHPQHLYHHIISTSAPETYQEEDIHLQDYQMSSNSSSMINDPSSHSHNICGIEINTLPGSSSGGNHDIPQLARMEKRKRTNYSVGGNKAKIEEAVKYLLELSERARPNVRNVAEKMGIPYNTLRDHFKKAQGLMAPPRRTVFDYPMAEYKGAEVLEEHPVEPEPEPPAYDIRRRGRKPALPRLIEYQLKVFIKEMAALGLIVDRTQLKQVAYKIATDLNLVEFKATDMWLQAFQARHSLTVAHSGGSKKKGWRLPDVPIYGSSTYTQYKVTHAKSLEMEYPEPVDYSVLVDQTQHIDGVPSENISLSNSLTQQQQCSHVELDYPFPPESLRMLQALVPPPSPSYTSRFHVALNDEELRVRAIASFRKVLGEIQSLLVADGVSLMSLINQDALRPSSEIDSQKNRCELARLIMPQIEKCTVLGIGYSDEQSWNGEAASHPPSPSIISQEDINQSGVRESHERPNIKRQRVLPLSSFQSSQGSGKTRQSTVIEDTSIDNPAVRPKAPEDEQTGTASALSATQVLYSSSSAHSHHHPPAAPNVSNYISPTVFSAMSAPAPVDLRRRRMQFAQNDEMAATAHGNNEPVMVTTKIHHPRSVFYVNPPTHEMMSNYRAATSDRGVIAMRSSPIINSSSVSTSPTASSAGPVFNMNLK